MTRFAKGDQVIIRFGTRQGQKGKIIESQPANVYKVRAEDGSVHFFSEKGLDREKEGVRPVGCGTGSAAWGDHGAR
jgi:ribosomal protein L24